MRPLLVAAVWFMALAGALMASPAIAGGAGGQPAPLYGPSSPSYERGGRAVPRGFGLGERPDMGGGQSRSFERQDRVLRPRIVCDNFGRCWRDVPSGFDDDGRFGARPPGWADDLPRRLRDPDRFLRPRSGVVCDRGTAICYKNGRVDKSETKSIFGERAADRADDLRDRRGTGRVFVPERGVSCDTARRICFDGGFADYSLTRRYFGREAADQID